MDGVTLVDLTDRLDDPAIRGLLALAMGQPSAETLAALGERYRCEPNWTLLGHAEYGVGCVGVERAGRDCLVIRHIAVTPACRRQGIGRALLAALGEQEPSRWFVAETDGEAVGFYRRCGFAVESLGERYPGVERFRCTRQPRGRQ
ncbi:MAG TPA: GNAT family N-acetyltransferase [Thermomicrobiaceae bacterium]|nr:GNAT family N-acetyltransferase [Thermomicrobiaceae bacterium]